MVWRLYSDHEEAYGLINVNYLDENERTDLMRLTARFLFLPALAVACLLVAQVAQAQHSITFDGYTTTGDGELPYDASPTISGITDFSGLGSDGSWFFNFDQSANTGSAPEFGEVDDLPSWITVDKTSADPTVRTLADGAQLNTSSGGQAGWSSITLPTAAGGATGVSGAVVAPGTIGGDSANVFEDMYITGLGAGQKVSFTMSIVVDNTNGEHDPDKRMKVRAKKDGGATEVNLRLNSLQSMDGSPDVYSFIFDGWVNTDELRLQLRNNDDLKTASIAGIMFDDVSIIPEPTSAMLLLLGGMGLALAGRRRREGRVDSRLNCCSTAQPPYGRASRQRPACGVGSRPLRGHGRFFVKFAFESQPITCVYRTRMMVRTGALITVV